MILAGSTYFNKRIPKQKFYENLDVSAEIKRAFVEQIKSVYWKNKIAVGTVNVAEGQIVSEIEVFEIKLSSRSLDLSVLKEIDRQIPYHIVFLLEYEGQVQAWTAYKEASGSGNFAFKVGNYYHTEWMDESELPLKIDGLNMDQIYENFVRQIAGDHLQVVTSDETLAESVNRSEKRKSLEKQIIKLQTKIRKEKQLNRQMEMNGEVKKLRKELLKL